MSWWSRLTGGKVGADPKPHRINYLKEALVLERQGDYDAALTSYRLALRDRPNDPKILQNMAIAFSKTGQQDDAMRAYKKALDIAPELAGAHYGLAFLLLKKDDRAGAVEHLESFLVYAPSSPDTEKWIKHAEETLGSLKSGIDPAPEAGS